MTITIYTAQQIELTEKKYYLKSALTNWAFCIDPDSDRVKVTTERNPFGDNSFDNYSKEIDQCHEISEARFFEILATNYQQHLDILAHIAKEWGLELFNLREVIDAERASEENADYRMEVQKERYNDILHDPNY